MSQDYFAHNSKPVDILGGRLLFGAVQLPEHFLRVSDPII